MKNKLKMRDWSALPEELLNEIIEKLESNVDYLAIRATCKLWRLATQRMPLHYPRQLPLLMLPNDKNERTHLTFSLSDDKIFQLKLSKAQRPWFCGSSNGWLVTMHVSPLIILWNPFTNAQIELPPLTTFPDVLSFDESKVASEYTIRFQTLNKTYTCAKETMRNYFIRKAVLSSDPVLDPDYTVVVIYGFWKQLAFCKHGDKKWSRVEREESYFDDITYYNKQFYVVDTFGRISNFSIHPFPHVVELIPPLLKNDQFYYLVESNGELLQVVKFWSSVDECSKILEYEVLKLDIHRGKRIWIDNLGNHSLFLGMNESVCLSARDFPGVKKNCIYFTEDSELIGPPTQVGDCGIFDMEDGTITPFPCSAMSKMGRPQLIWFHTSCRQNEILERGRG